MPRRCRCCRHRLSAKLYSAPPADWKCLYYFFVEVSLNVCNKTATPCAAVLSLHLYLCRYSCATFWNTQFSDTICCCCRCGWIVREQLRGNCFALLGSWVKYTSLLLAYKLVSEQACTCNACYVAYFQACEHVYTYTHKLLQTNTHIHTPIYIFTNSRFLQLNLS